jgi:all-trans-retinol 13,14-reductase
MNKYDIIIIGSGLGGLVCGYILSKNGYKVAILEKNAQIGGCLQTFTRKGIKFDTGMHYIGSMNKGQIMYRFFKYLNLTEDVKISRLNRDGHDIINFRGEEYPLASGYENFEDKLSEKFPKNRSEIKEYIKRIRKIANASPLYNLHEINNSVFIETDYIKTSINDFIASITSNNVLRNVLAGNLPLYAGTKDKTPTYIHALINNLYIQSAYRIIGGSDIIAESLAKSIRSFGGDVFTKSDVLKIICDEYKAKAVMLADGTIFEGENFISNIHPQATLEKLDSNLIRKAYRDRINELGNTISNFTLYLKFKENTTPYLNYNYYYYDNESVWDASSYKIDTWPNSYLYMHQCSKDLQKYADSAEMIGYMRFDEVKQWEDTTIGQRGSDYIEFKERKAQLMLDKLEKSFPGIKNSIESYYTSSPLTYRDYTATKEGSMYGIERDKNFPTQTLVSQRTKIPNLFLTGQNINSHGILGVTIGAVITCAEFLGINFIIKDIEKTNN